MLVEKTIKNQGYWQKQFGLYPMLMYPKNNKNKFLMLNGGSKDFCLQIDIDNFEREVFFSESWSTNTKNYVVFNKDNVHLFNWLKNGSEDIPIKKVEDNPEKFYTYLSGHSYKTPDDVVPYIISVFRELRNYSGKEEPEEALNLLFRLLISIDENDDYTKLDPSLWGIKDGISLPKNFDDYVQQLRKGVNSIVPKRELILRHISGALFQEAHKQVVYFDRQEDLFGGYSSKLITKNDVYSSVHYTPPYLARTIVENCLKQLDLEKKCLKIFDPACGSSEFLIETLKQLQNLNYKGKLKIIGWDTSLSAVCTSNFLLKYEQRTQWNNGNLKYEIKKIDNSLTEQWDNDYDLIVMNPPFISWELLETKKSKDAIVATLGSLYKGKPNQAVAFFYKAVKSLHANGVLGCLLPTTILTSDTYSKLRKEIEEELSILLLAKLGNYIFETALTDISFIIGKKSETNNLPKLIWSKNEKGIASDVLMDFRKMEYKNQMMRIENNCNIYIPHRFPILPNSWKIIAQKEENFLLSVKRFTDEKQLSTTSELFEVKQGIRTGNNQVFIITCDKFNYIPDKEKIFYRKVINNDSINDGVLSLINYVWYPYNSDGMIFTSENQFKKMAPFSYKKLLQYKDTLHKDRARKNIDTWWYLSEHRTWLRKNEPRLYSTEFGNSGSFTIDTIGDFVVERGCAWIPKKIIKKEDYYFYLSILSSNIFDFLLSIYSKQLAGGNWYDLGAKYINNIPIPNVNLNDIRTLKQYSGLVELGKELLGGNPYLKQAITDIVRYFYPEL